MVLFPYVTAPESRWYLVFCPPLQGKPDPRESWDPAVGDTRPRVPQDPQKGGTCWYYALARIRDRIKQPVIMPAQTLLGRVGEVEVQTSGSREQLKQLLAEQLDIAYQRTCGKCPIAAINSINYERDQYTKKDAEGSLRATLSLKSNRKIECPQLLDKQQKTENLLKSFCEQDRYPDLLRFAISNVLSFTTSFYSSRELEIRVSEYRKKCTQIDQANLEEYAKKLAKYYKGPMTKERAQQHLEHLISIQHQLGQTGIKRVCASFLKSFCEQTEYPDLLSFASRHIWNTKEDHLAQLLFGEFGISSALMRERWPRLIKELRYSTPFWVGCIYKLKLSAWHPTHPITSLMDQISMHGPLVVCGYFGRPYYKDDPFELSAKVEGQSVFGWQPGSIRIVLQSSHAIVLVGARNDMDHVYFIDPNDGSDPANIQTQKIYVMSYKRLTSSMTDLFGYKRLAPPMIDLFGAAGRQAFTKAKTGENFCALHANKALSGSFRKVLRGKTKKTANKVSPLIFCLPFVILTFCLPFVMKRGSKSASS